MRTPRDAIQDLVEKAYDYHIMLDSMCRGNEGKAKKVGELVLRSSENDRELLKQLTVDDINGVRYPPQDYRHYIVEKKKKKASIDPTFRPGRKRGPVLIKL